MSSEKFVAIAVSRIGLTLEASYKRTHIAFKDLTYVCKSTKPTGTIEQSSESYRNDACKTNWHGSACCGPLVDLALVSYPPHRAALP